jgi:hypothetical protein
MLEWFWTFANELAAAVPCRRLRFVDPPRPQAQPARLSRAEGWTRATGAITAALAGFERIQDLQAAAASRLDAADYAFQCLLEELATAMPAVMPIPADGSALRAVLAAAAEPPAAKKALAA